MFSPALSLSISNGEVKDTIEISEPIENGIKVVIEDDVVITNGGPEHHFNRTNDLVIVNGASEQVIDVVREQVVVDDNMQTVVNVKEEVGRSFN